MAQRFFLRFCQSPLFVFHIRQRSHIKRWFLFQHLFENRRGDLIELQFFRAFLIRQKRCQIIGRPSHMLAFVFSRFNQFPLGVISRLKMKDRLRLLSCVHRNQPRDIVKPGPKVIALSWFHFRQQSFRFL